MTCESMMILSFLPAGTWKQTYNLNLNLASFIKFFFNMFTEAFQHVPYSLFGLILKTKIVYCKYACVYVTFANEHFLLLQEPRYTILRLSGKRA